MYTTGAFVSVAPIRELWRGRGGAEGGFHIQMMGCSLYLLGVQIGRLVPLRALKERVPLRSKNPFEQHPSNKILVPITVFSKISDEYLHPPPPPLQFL